MIWSTVHNRQHLSDFVLLSLFFIFLQAPPPGLNPKPAFSIHTERWMGESIALALEITQTFLFLFFLGGALGLNLLVNEGGACISSALELSAITFVNHTSIRFC